MADAVVTFERENAEGLVAVGSYLGDAAKRLGVKFEAECTVEPAEHHCAVEVKKGGELLSEATAGEKETLKDAKLGRGWRLACHAKIEKVGEVVVMTKEKPKVEEEAEKE
jgi:ferredoxin